MENFFKTFKKYREDLNTISAIINIILVLTLMFVTIRLIAVTSSSVKATNSIKNVEVYLIKEQINQRITLSENLINELKIQTAGLGILQKNLEESRHESGAITGSAYLVRLQQAQDSPQFGTSNIRIVIDHILSEVNALNRNLEEMRTSERAGDSKTKIEHADESWRIIENLKPFITTLIKQLEEYRENEKNEYIDIDKKLS